MCDHHYAIPKGVGFKFCLICKQTVKDDEGQTAESRELVMPPRIFEITERLWKDIAPWPNIPFRLVKEYGWYISYLSTTQYLIMPVFREKKIAYYSARKLLESENGSKYQYPLGVKKLCWISNDTSPTKLIICEGVADAVYCSNLATSVALLGSYYNRELDYLVRNRIVYLLLDGDSAGILAALHMAPILEKLAKQVITVILPDKKDPTDFTLDELRGYITT